MEKYGYVRVSAVDQNEARQLLEMEQLGIKPKTFLLISNLEKTLTKLREFRTQ